MKFTPEFVFTLCVQVASLAFFLGGLYRALKAQERNNALLLANIQELFERMRKTEVRVAALPAIQHEQERAQVAREELSDRVSGAVVRISKVETLCAERHTGKSAAGGG